MSCSMNMNISSVPNLLVVGRYAARYLVLLMVVLAGANAPRVIAGEPDAAPVPAIQYLLDYVTRSDLTFIRNSSTYTSAEAADHMNKKYQHFSDEIKTPEDFIRLCASRSLLSGKPYTVITGQGKKVPTSEWLKGVLSDYLAQNTTALH